MALNLFDLVSEDHHPTQSHRFRVRPMTKVYSLRDTKREMRGGGRRRLARSCFFHSNLFRTLFMIP